MMDWNDLKGYVGAGNEDDAFLQQCWDEASELVTGFIGGSTFGNPVPDVIKDRAVLEVASELFHRRQAPNGIQQFAGYEGNANAVRVARDPMVAAYPLLRRYMVIL